MGVDLQPDELEALQAEPAGEPPVKVEVIRIEGPVRTQELPRKQAGSISKTVPASLPAVRLLRADHRRAIARIVATGNPILVAFNQASAADATTMASWPINVPLNITADSEVWVAGSGGPAVVSVITEFWATGE